MGPDNQEPDENKQPNDSVNDSQPADDGATSTPSVEGSGANESVSDFGSQAEPIESQNGAEPNAHEVPVNVTSSNSGADNPSSLSEALADLSKEDETGPAPAAAVNDSQDTPTPVPIDEPKPAKTHGKKAWLWALIVILLIVILGGLWLYFIYLPNRPSAVYSSSLSRSGQAVDKLIDYAKNASPENFKNVAVTGSATVNGKNYQFTGGLDGSYNQDGNTTTTLNVDSKTEGNSNSHVKAALDLRTLKGAGQTYPDIYLRATGISSLLDMVGASQFDSLDGKWIEVSHNFIKQYADEATGQTDSSQDKSPTKAQIYDAIDKVQAVNKKYLFTDDPQTAVLVKKQYVGAETKYGRDVYHYKMGYNKDHLAAYVSAVGQALDSSQLNDWSQKNFKKSLSEQMDVKSAQEQIKKLDSGYTFDMWADRDTKLIEALEFADKDHPGNNITIAQTYSGGHTYPFIIEVNGDEDGDKGSLTMKFTVDADKHQVTTSFNFNDNDHGNQTTAQGNFTVAESNNSAKVERPTGATPIEEILGIPVVGATTKDSAKSDAKSSDKKAATPTQTQQSSDTDIQDDAASLLVAAAEYASNNNGSSPKYAVQMGKTVELCENAGCTGAKPSTAKMASGQTVVISTKEPKSGSNQMVLAPGMKCSDSKLVAGSSRDIAVSYYLGKNLACQN